MKENSALQDKRSAKPVQAPAAVEEAVKPVEKQNVPAPVEAVQVQPQVEKPVPAPTPAPVAAETPAVQAEEKKAPADAVEGIIVETAVRVVASVESQSNATEQRLALAEHVVCARTEATENRVPQDPLCRPHLSLRSLPPSKTLS